MNPILTNFVTKNGLWFMKGRDSFISKKLSHIKHWSKMFHKVCRRRRLSQSWDQFACLHVSNFILADHSSWTFVLFIQWWLTRIHVNNLTATVFLCLLWLKQQRTKYVSRNRIDKQFLHRQLLRLCFDSNKKNFSFDGRWEVSLQMMISKFIPMLPPFIRLLVRFSDDKKVDQKTRKKAKNLAQNG